MLAPLGERGLASPAARRVLLVAGCAVLFLVFCVIRFPFERFRAPLASQLSQATGARVSIERLAGRPGPALLTLVAESVRIDFDDGRSLAVERAAARPAWSLSWLRGRPALHVDVRAREGRIAGTLWPDAAAPGFAGRLEDVDLAALAALVPALREAAFQGRADAELSLAFGPDGPEGELSLRARDGSFAPPGAPLAVPFETLRAEARRAARGPVELAEVALEGPLLAGSLHGTIGPADRPDDAPLDLEVVIERIDPALAGVADVAGGSGLPAAGRPLRVGGTLGAPLVR